MDSDVKLKRKIYNKMLDWKRTRRGKTALLIEGARRVGKSTIVREFAKNEYKSYILIDFSRVSKEVKSLFDDISNLDYIFFPGIRKAVEEKVSVIKAYAVKEGALAEFEMTLGELTDEERQIILKGCLINYNRI